MTKYNFLSSNSCSCNSHLPHCRVDSACSRPWGGRGAVPQPLAGDKHLPGTRQQVGTLNPTRGVCSHVILARLLHLGGRVPSLSIPSPAPVYPNSRKGYFRNTFLLWPVSACMMDIFFEPEDRVNNIFRNAHSQISWLRLYITNRKVVGSIPDEVV
jgi:hypothetical protein